ncbi:MAG: mechanosensitive ion channel family protein [Phycisphaerales bacterium]|nr:mechanosensitive ion channel family protein [Phycisphaerales bacterium]
MPSPTLSQNAQTLAQEAADAVTGALDRQFLGNTVGQWITFGAVLVGSFIVVWLLKVVLLARLRKWAERTTTRIDDFAVSLVSDIRLWLIFPALVMLAARGLTMRPQIERIIYITAMVGIAVQLILSSRLLIDFGLKTLANKHRGPDGNPDPTLISSLGVLRVIGMFVIVTVVVLLALDNLGIEIKPLLAGLGIGGIAVALAVQNLLSDLFGSLTILLDKPFVVGDAITVGDKSGTVERIGIKTTRVRATSGEQIVFANSDLLSSRLHNYKRMTERRVQFSFGLTYETPPDQLAEVPRIVRAAVEKQPATRFDRCHLSKLNTSSVDYETVYFVTNADYTKYMDIQQAINLEMLSTFTKRKIEFAYPTQVAIQKNIGGTDSSANTAAAAGAVIAGPSTPPRE